MSSSDAEYDQYDLSEFTPDDFAAVDASIARTRGPTPDSPFTQFRSWRNFLVVTDLVSPLWCELQFEYSLYGKSHKPLSQRPTSFTSKGGKQIHVHQQVARSADRRLKRGKSIHKALENELRPVKVTVRAVSQEERFALRLVQLIDGFNELTTNGITRELPVFAITHNQFITGVIDEVFLSAVPQAPQGQSILPGSTIPPKLTQLSPADPQITSPQQHLLTELSAVITDTTPNGLAPTLPWTPEDRFELHILDYKTRQSSDLPLDQDSLSPRLQLMLYHRMLSSLLQPEAFDFNLVWSRLNLDPLRPFSDMFLQDVSWNHRRAGPKDSNVHLDRLVWEWTSTIRRQRPALTGVSQQLQLVYRASVSTAKRPVKGKHPITATADRDDPFEALAIREELDLARAIEESLGEMGYQQVLSVTNHVAQIIKRAGPSVGHPSALWEDIVSASSSDQTDPGLAWAIQQSLLACAHKSRDQVPAHETDAMHDDTRPEEAKSNMPEPDEPVQKRATAEISPIIGTKKFTMDDEELDRHIADVLQWWLGVRPARGVDIRQANRCFTCEYQDSCEWRERKAREVAALVQIRYD